MINKMEKIGNKQENGTTKMKLNKRIKMVTIGMRRTTKMVKNGIKVIKMIGKTVSNQGNKIGKEKEEKDQNKTRNKNYDFIHKNIFK